ncbi:serine hydrolase domain-containing protein [Peristeroidobacter soli]|uniref:serine hydrolase domain-containing protein n=1 Tax=Peristeroidobacter soli TaxID=2497877 RepID=UPI00101C3752|nr:serine hydrolase domain-containing protein [Peristeroidobacter soli]
MRKLSMRALLLAVCWLSFAVSASAQDESKQRAVDALFGEVTADGPGIAVGIYHEGKTIYAHGYGNAIPGRDAPITEHTVFHVASVSKEFTAFAIALLVRDGKVKLDDDIRTYLPQMPDFGAPITVGDLVHHLSGLKEQNMMFWMAQRYRNDNLKQQQALSLIARQRGLVSPPGTRFSYNNTGYTLLAAIVQAASGQTLRQFTDARIFEPLGMKQTLFRDDASEIIPELADGFTPRGKGWGRAVLGSELVGPTGLHSSVTDMMKWLANFDQPRVGDAAFIERVFTPGKLRDGKPINYAFGLFNQDFAGHPAITHDGSDYTYRSTLVYLPKERFGVVLLANSQRNLGDIARKIVELYLGAAPGPRSIVDGGAPVIQSTAKQRQALVGHYLNPYLWAADIVEKDGKLQWLSTGWPSSDVQLRKDDVFSRTLGTELRYFKIDRDKRGAVTGFRLVGALGEDTGDRYERIPPVSPTLADLQLLTGDYRTGEVDITYTFTVQDGQLTARSIWSTKPIRLSPVTADRYDTDDIPMGSIEFVREPSGKPTGFRIVGGGMRGTVFERVAPFVR